MSITMRTMLRLALLAPLLACRTPVPQQELQVADLEAYWAIDSAVGDRQYIAPVVRFRVTNKFGEAQTTVQATASFRRKGEEDLDWGSGFVEVSSRKRPLAPGQSTQVTMKSDGRYYSSGDPATFFEHKLFKDARVTIYLRIGSSNWERFGELDVPRHIGSKALAEASR